jgi:sugar lactone lactonase YvrE
LADGDERDRLGEETLRVKYDAVACTTEQNELGEGTRWDARRDELLRVDILAGRIYRDRVAEDGTLIAVEDYTVPGTVGAITPIDGDHGWLLAADRGFVHLSVDGVTRQIADHVSPVATRMNDAACDPQGRLWAGTLADDHHAGGGALYRLDTTGRIDQMLNGLTISNGLGWSPDGDTMYFVDSGPRRIYAFAFDGETGSIAERRILVTIDSQVGAPDGLTVDTDGDLWVAIFGGGRVQRYAPDGTLREELFLPATECTSCAFAGAQLDRLYVTTATEHWTDEQRQAEPSAGLVYRFETDASGEPADPFRPDASWW